MLAIGNNRTLKGHREDCIHKKPFYIMAAGSAMPGSSRLCARTNFIQED